MVGPDREQSLRVVPEQPVDLHRRQLPAGVAEAVAQLLDGHHRGGADLDLFGAARFQLDPVVDLPGQVLRVFQRAEVPERLGQLVVGKSIACAPQRSAAAIWARFKKGTSISP